MLRGTPQNGWAGVTKYLRRTLILSLAILALGAVPAFAYKESSSQMATSSTTPNSCPTCHGLEYISQPTSSVASVSKPSTWSAFDTEASSTVGSRKGPHGGYTSGTQKCQTCHVIHDAPGNVALLPQNTIDATCYTCHDGTGGGGVYGVIRFRTGVAPAAQHRVGAASLNGSAKVTVPGGDPITGGSIDTTFTGENGALTCTDCHSPHNSKTVKPFIGDRKRSVADTSSAIPTNKLLRQTPTKGTTVVTEYGSDWCEACHKGRHSAASTIGNHPAADTTTAPGWDYSHVNVVTGFNTNAVAAAKGSLGGSNFGYVMQPGEAQPFPICQQCHEDARTVGNTTQFQVSSTTESFTTNADGVNGGNPRFQNFPHESQNPSFLIETGDGLCLNCHPTSPN